MSASPITRPPVGTKAIPIRRVVVQDPADLPAHYSATPGGTLYSTTPGGTRIVYERNFLMNLRNSPISKTPPTCDIPTALAKGTSNPPKAFHSNHKSSSYGIKQQTPKRNAYNNHNNNKRNNEDDQFEMDL